jgi:hypothetical protein
MAPHEAPQKLSLVALKSEREKTIQTLTDAFAADLFDVDEFELRVSKAHEAKTREALVHLRSDVEAAREEAAPSTALAPVDREAQEALVRAQPDSKWAVALLGGCERKGQWRVPKKLRVGALLGGCDLDFREALVSPGTSEVNILACLGGVDIIVPPDLNVECEGVGILGGFESAESGGQADASRPTLRISGLALLGGVRVSTRLPGESARQAKKRLKLERKALKKKQLPKQLK